MSFEAQQVQDAAWNYLTSQVGFYRPSQAEYQDWYYGWSKEEITEQLNRIQGQTWSYEDFAKGVTPKDDWITRALLPEMIWNSMSAQEQAAYLDSKAKHDWLMQNNKGLQDFSEEAFMLYDLAVSAPGLVRGAFSLGKAGLVWGKDAIYGSELLTRLTPEMVRKIAATTPVKTYESGGSALVLEYNAANNVAVRQAYLKQLEAIPGKIDTTLPLREQAMQAFNLRNAAKIDARAAMTDRNAAVLLDRTDPIPTIQDVVRRAYKDKGLVGDDMWRSILESSTRSRSSVNQALGVGN